MFTLSSPLRVRLKLLALCSAAAQLPGSACAQVVPVGTAAPLVTGQWEGNAQPTRGWPLFLLLDLNSVGGARGTLFVLGQTVKFDSVKLSDAGFVATSGSGTDALRLEGSIKGAKLVGTLTQSGDILPFTLDRIPTYPKANNRIEAWSQDVDAFATRFPKAERSFTPATRARFDLAVARLKRDLPRLDDQHIQARLAAAMALADNAHTRLYLVRVRTQVRLLPLRTWWFADGLRIVRTAPGQRGLLGCRIVGIGDRSIAQARAAVDPLYAGSATWRDYMSAYTLMSPDLLLGTDVIKSADRVELRLADCPAAGSVSLAPLPLAKSNAATEAWWDLLPTPPRDADWPQVAKVRNAPVPLYLTDAEHYYWHRFMPESGILYFQYNRAADMAAESTKDYAKRLLAAFDVNPVKAFVLDLRFDTGGNGGLADDLMKALRERTKGMPRFVIIGRATFSAGISAAARWREVPDVALVGEPAGDRLDFWAEGGNILLPNSGLAAHFANGPHSYSRAPCQHGLYCLDGNAPDLTPDIRANLSWGDYIKGRDPALEAISARLKGSGSATIRPAR
jgi:hypothetical protein